MSFKKYERLRLREFNDFDVERILKENANDLEEKNDETISFLENNKFSEDLPSSMIRDMEKEVRQNAAEIVHLLSITHHTDDLASTFFRGPLYRRSRDVND